MKKAPIVILGFLLFTACSQPAAIILQNEAYSEIVIRMSKGQDIHLKPGKSIKLAFDHNLTNSTFDLNSQSFTYDIKYPPADYYVKSGRGGIFGLSINDSGRLSLRNVSPDGTTVSDEALIQPDGFPISGTQR